MTVSTISPQETETRQKAGEAVVIDVRTTGEVRREYLESSIFIPHEIVTPQRIRDVHADGKQLVFLCHSGNRAMKAAEHLADELPNVRVLDGGIERWKKEGLPVVTADVVIPMERQVLIAAGGMILVSLGLAAAVTSSFLWWTTFVGAGLVFAGATGFCGMAKLLALMPWNRQHTRASCCTK